MPAIVIPVPSHKAQLPAAVAYMMGLGDRCLSRSQFVQVLVRNRRCAGGDPWQNCYRCAFAYLCARLFDGVVDRLAWYSKARDVS